MSLKGIKKRRIGIVPLTAEDKLFCERWLIHFDKDRAYREAGFGKAGGRYVGHLAISKLEKFADYLRPIQEAKAKAMAERLAVDSEKILEGMTKKVFFDPTSFYERTQDPLTETVKEKVNGETVEVERPILWDGKPVYGERMRPYSDLTPEQQAVVEITSTAGGRIQYRLPSIREQHQYFTSIGRQFGMFAEKLILERHNHTHKHTHLSFEKVPTQRLTELSRQMLPLVDREYAQMLGFSPEEIEAAALEMSVVVEVEKSPA